MCALAACSLATIVLSFHIESRVMRNGKYAFFFLGHRPNSNCTQSTVWARAINAGVTDTLKLIKCKYRDAMLQQNLPIVLIVKKKTAPRYLLRARARVCVSLCANIAMKEIEISSLLFSRKSSSFVPLKKISDDTVIYLNNNSFKFRLKEQTEEGVAFLCCANFARILRGKSCI